LKRLDATEKEIPIRIAPRRTGDPSALIASSEKIKCELGWKPQYQNLECIIASAWAWMQTHKKSD